NGFLLTFAFYLFTFALLRLEILTESGRKVIPDSLHVLPHLALFRGIAQQVGGIKCWHQFHAVVVVEFATHLRDALLGAKQRARGRVAECDYDFRMNSDDLAV